MNRHRDHLAPSDLTEDQLEGIKGSGHIRHLREQRLTLRDEMRALYGTLKKAKHADPDRYREHETVVKELTRVRAVHRRERKAEFRQDYFETMPVVGIDKQIDQLLGESVGRGRRSGKARVTDQTAAMMERASTPSSICLSDPQRRDEAVAQEGAQK
jgi:Protein of unknown function (DUF3435)